MVLTSWGFFSIGEAGFQLLQAGAASFDINLFVLGHLNLKVLDNFVIARGFRGGQCNIHPSREINEGGRHHEEDEEQEHDIDEGRQLQ